MTQTQLKRGVDFVGEPLLAVLELLEKTLCPRCQRPCLTFEHKYKSGVMISCDGFDPSGDDGECQYREFFLFTSHSDLPRLGENAIVNGNIETDRPAF